MLSKKIIIGTVATPVSIAAVIVGILIFTAPKAPPPIAAIQGAGDSLRAFAEAQPVAQYLTARDGRT